MSWKEKCVHVIAYVSFKHFKFSRWKILKHLVKNADALDVKIDPPLPDFGFYEGQQSLSPIAGYPKSCPGTPQDFIHSSKHCTNVQTAPQSVDKCRVLYVCWKLRAGSISINSQNWKFLFCSADTEKSVDETPSSSLSHDIYCLKAISSLLHLQEGGLPKIDWQQSII